MKKLIYSLTSVLMVIAAANLASACWVCMYQPEMKSRSIRMVEDLLLADSVFLLST